MIKIFTAKRDEKTLQKQKNIDKVTWGGGWLKYAGFFFKIVRALKKINKKAKLFYLFFESAHDFKKK